MTRPPRGPRLAGWAGLLCLGLVARSFAAPPDAPFELKDGDRVVLLGGTFIEREQEYGYLETLLTSRFPDRNITFRNLGWSGDTVRGEARARFGPPAEGFDHLKSHVEALKPTVILVNYGLNESFAGKAGLPAFEKDLKTLLDVLDKTGARIVLITPRRLEKLPPPAARPGEGQRAAGRLRGGPQGRGGSPVVSRGRPLRRLAARAGQGVHRRRHPPRRPRATAARRMSSSACSG